MNEELRAAYMRQLDLYPIGALFGGFGTGISKRTTRSRYATEVTEASTAQDEAGAGATTRARWASACGKAKEWPQSSAEAPETFPRRATTVTGDFGVTKGLRGQGLKAAELCQKFEAENNRPQRPRGRRRAKKQTKAKAKPKETQESEEAEEEDEEFVYNHQPTWCICMNPRRDDDGMIKCSNRCPYEWWHYKCVPMDNKKWPGEWYCPECRVSKDKARTPLSEEILNEKLHKYNDEYNDKLTDLIARNFPLSG